MCPVGNSCLRYDTCRTGHIYHQLYKFKWWCNFANDVLSLASKITTKIGLEPMLCLEWHYGSMVVCSTSTRVPCHHSCLPIASTAWTAVACLVWHIATSILLSSQTWPGHLTWLSDGLGQTWPGHLYLTIITWHLAHVDSQQSVAYAGCFVIVNLAYSRRVRLSHKGDTRPQG